MTDEALTQVRAAHRFDEARLAHYLSQQLPDFAGPLNVQQFEGGQSNPTYLLSTPARKYVLRKKPPGQLLPSAHMIEREYRVMQALQNSAVPVPPVHLLCADESIIGTPFYVMGYVEGRLLRDPTLPGLAGSERQALYKAMIKALAALHMLDYTTAGLSDFGKPDGYIGRTAVFEVLAASHRIRELISELGLHFITRAVLYVMAPGRDQDVTAAMRSPVTGRHA